MDNREYVKALKTYPMALTVKETSQILRVSTKLVYHMIQDGTLSSVRIGRQHRVPKTVLIQFMRGM